MKNPKKYMLFSILLFLIPSLVSAQYFRNWYEWLHVPPEYSRPPDILYFLILPFLGVFAIVWGVLTKIEIFKQHRVNLLLALIFALSMVYYGHLFKFVHFLYSIGSFFAFLAYAFLFFSGVWLFSKRKVRDWKSSELRELKEAERELRELRENLKEVNRELTYETNEKTIEQLKQKKSSFESRIGELERRIDKLRQEIRIEKETPE